MKDELLTIGELQDFLKIGRTRAYELVQNELPVVRVGRSLRVRRSAVEEYLAQNTTGAEPTFRSREREKSNEGRR